MKDLEKYQASKDYIIRKISSSNVLISVGKNIANFNGYIQLNDSAAFLWKQLQEPKTAEELAVSLQNEFEIGTDQAQFDVKDFLDELIQEKMVNVL